MVSISCNVQSLERRNYPSHRWFLTDTPQAADDLLFEIGRVLVAERLVEAPRPVRDASGQRSGCIKAASEWITQNKRTIQEAICGKEFVLRYIKGDLSSEVDLVKAMGDCLSAAFVFIPAVTLANYILRYGLSRFCSEK